MKMTKTFIFALILLCTNMYPITVEKVVTALIKERLMFVSQFGLQVATQVTQGEHQVTGVYHEHSDNNLELILIKLNNNQVLQITSDEIPQTVQEKFALLTQQINDILPK